MDADAESKFSMTKVLSFRNKEKPVIPNSRRAKICSISESVKNKTPLLNQSEHAAFESSMKKENSRRRKFYDKRR